MPLPDVPASSAAVQVLMQTAMMIVASVGLHVASLLHTLVHAAAISAAEGWLPAPPPLPLLPPPPLLPHPAVVLANAKSPKTKVADTEAPNTETSLFDMRVIHSLMARNLPRPSKSREISVRAPRRATHSGTGFVSYGGRDPRRTISPRLA
jgi:hypothetical protein